MDAPIYQLRVMSPDGSGVRQLTHMRIPRLLSGLTATAWSADGSRLLAEYGGEDTSEAWTVDVRSGRARDLTGRVDGVIGSDLSADRRTVLVQRGSFDDPQHQAVATIPFGGGHATVLVPRQRAELGRLSPADPLGSPPTGIHKIDYRAFDRIGRGIARCEPHRLLQAAPLTPPPSPPGGVGGSGGPERRRARSAAASRRAVRRASWRTRSRSSGSAAEARSARLRASSSSSSGVGSCVDIRSLVIGSDPQPLERWAPATRGRLGC
ncbi:MAG TPA: hypothetical protein VFF79_07115 [Conexibacter sp.]|jgi:hypothetical protein|nr:hypothetical protein [Conexibacter sp.]